MRRFHRRPIIAEVWRKRESGGKPPHSERVINEYVPNCTKNTAVFHIRGGAELHYLDDERTKRNNS